MDNNAYNREKLAYNIAEEMELSTLIDFTTAALVEIYRDDDERFREDWRAEFGEEADD